MLQVALASGAPPAVHRGRQVNAWQDDNGHVFMRAYADGTRRWLDWPGLGVFGFTDRFGPIQAWLAPGVAPEPALDTFRRVVQPIVLQACGDQALHASAVETPDGALIVCGQSGAGKSTLACAVARRPRCRQLADDAVVVTIDGESIAVRPLPFRPRLRPSAHAQLATDESVTTRVDVPRSVPVRAVVVIAQRPDLAGPPLLARLPTPAAFTTLLTHAHCFDEAAQDPNETRRLVGDYLTIAAHVPVYTLAYRPDFNALRDLVDRAMSATTWQAAVVRA